MHKRYFREGPYNSTHVFVTPKKGNPIVEKAGRSVYEVGRIIDVSWETAISRGVHIDLIT